MFAGPNSSCTARPGETAPRTVILGAPQERRLGEGWGGAGHGRRPSSGRKNEPCQPLGGSSCNRPSRPTGAKGTRAPSPAAATRWRGAKHAPEGRQAPRRKRSSSKGDGLSGPLRPTSDGDAGPRRPAGLPASNRLRGQIEADHLPAGPARPGIAAFPGAAGDRSRTRSSLGRSRPVDDAAPPTGPQGARPRDLGGSLRPPTWRGRGRFSSSKARPASVIGAVVGHVRSPFVEVSLAEVNGRRGRPAAGT